MTNTKYFECFLEINVLNRQRFEFIPILIDKVLFLRPTQCIEFLVGSIILITGIKSVIDIPVLNISLLFLVVVFEVDFEFDLEFEFVLDFECEFDFFDCGENSALLLSLPFRFLLFGGDAC